MADPAETPLTVTEDLILDVLLARHRTGEHLWPFSSKLKKHLRSLEARGYITVMSGAVEKTRRASLTAAGIREFLTGSTYVSPIEKTNASLVMKNEALKEALVNS